MKYILTMEGNFHTNYEYKAFTRYENKKIF